VFYKKNKKKVGFYFRDFLVIATVPIAAAANAKTMTATIAVEYSDTLGVGVADADGSVIPLLVGTQSASAAAPLDVGV
jgi:hypothetical protein